MAGLVGHIAGAVTALAAERPLGQGAIGGAAELGPPAVQGVDRLRGLLGEDGHRILVAQEGAALEGVSIVVLPAVIQGHRRVDPALGRAGVGAQGVDLAQHRHPEGGVPFRQGQGRRQTGQPRPHDDDVVVMVCRDLHDVPPTLRLAQG